MAESIASVLRTLNQQGISQSDRPRGDGIPLPALRHSECGYLALVQESLNQQIEEDQLTVRFTYTVQTKFLDFLTSLREVATKFGSLRARSDHESTVKLEVYSRDDHKIQAVVLIDARWGWNQNTIMEGEVSLTVTGIWQTVLDLSAALDAAVRSYHTPSVHWWYANNHGADNFNLVLKSDQKICPEFYPWIQPSPDAYLDAYLKSSASVLLLIGPPGTGKTSLLRHLLVSRGLDAIVTYDRMLLSSDYLFLSFLRGNQRILVVEDADTLLLPREAENEGMARFLGASDGLVKVPEKKIVFSTNLESVQEIDSALLRPGRCFDVLHFRSLTAEEASRAAVIAGQPDPGRACTLADLWNPETLIRPAGLHVGFAPVMVTE